MGGGEPEDSLGSPPRALATCLFVFFFVLFCLLDFEAEFLAGQKTPESCLASWLGNPSTGVIKVHHHTHFVIMRVLQSNSHLPSHEEALYQSFLILALAWLSFLFVSLKTGSPKRETLTSLEFPF